MSNDSKMKNVLIIDDDIDIQKLFAKIFKNYHHYHLTTADNGAEAFLLIKSIKPDIILCDVMMPKMDGLELFVLLKHEPELSQIPFLFISANDSDEDTLIGFGLGADDYIKKPFYTKDVMSRIYDVLNKKIDKGVYDVNAGFYLSSSIHKNNVEGVLHLIAAANTYRSTLVGEDRHFKSMLVVEDVNRNPVGVIYILDDRVLNAVVKGEWGSESLQKLIGIKEGYIKYYPNTFNINIEPGINREIIDILHNGFF